VKCARVRSGDETGNVPIEGFLTYEILRSAVVVSGEIATAEIRCEIIIGGVTFTDGTTVKSSYSTDFDDFNTRNLEFNKPYTAHSNCRRFSVWQNGTRVAYYN
jgi:hypothetical protein